MREEAMKPISQNKLKSITTTAKLPAQAPAIDELALMGEDRVPRLGCLLCQELLVASDRS